MIHIVFLDKILISKDKSSNFYKPIWGEIELYGKNDFKGPLSKHIHSFQKSSNDF